MRITKVTNGYWAATIEVTYPCGGYNVYVATKDGPYIRAYGSKDVAKAYRQLEDTVITSKDDVLAFINQFRDV